MITTVTTNVVLCLMLTSRTLSPVPCPDNIPGCLVQHCDWVEETHYKPFKLEFPSAPSGLCIRCDLRTLLCGIRFFYGSIDAAPAVIPVIFHDVDPDPMSKDVHPIGVVFKDGMFRIIVLPREKHRPKEYMLEGDEKILVSPGFADMAGVVPCSLPSDFYKITKENIQSIMSQVSIAEEKFSRL